MTQEGYGWILERKEGKKRIAHIAAAGPAGTQFLPVFPTRTAALEYRNLRLQMPHLRSRKVEIVPI